MRASGSCLAGRHGYLSVLSSAGQVMFRVFLARSGECECVVHEGLTGGQR